MTMHAERSVPSVVDKRVGGVKMMCKEVDAKRNPTELFRRMNKADWDGALDVLQNNPNEARVWIRYIGLTWKYLPLHLICLQQRPPMPLLLALLKFYPQAASQAAPHDGNLPIHYACESGCDDHQIFETLLSASAASLEVKNNNNKTPILLCNPKSRGVLMKVLRQRKPLPVADGQPLDSSSRRDKDMKKSRREIERRNDIDTSWKETSSRSDHMRREGRQHNRPPPKTTPARYAKHHHSTFDDNEQHTEHTEPNRWEEVKTPRVSNNRRSGCKRQTKKNESFFSSSSSASLSSSSSSAGTDIDPATYISSKTTELARSALSFLYPSREGPPEGEGGDESLDKQVRSLTKANEELTKKLDQLTSTETNTENSKLCERILAKAEADSVAFRTQIQQLEDEKQEMRKEAEAKEGENERIMDQMRKLICEKGSEMKINPFGDRSDIEGNDQTNIVEALQRILSHMDERNSDLHSKLATLEIDLCANEVALKASEAKNRILQEERESMIKRQHDLESRAAILEEEKEMVQTGLGHLKDRVCTLTVINESLQERVDSMSKSQGPVKQENDQFRSELTRLNEQLAQIKEDKDSTVPEECQKVAEMEEKVEALLEKNRSLKDTILLNNEKYSKKVQQLGEKYSALEKANNDLRQSLARSSDGARSDLRVRFQKESENILYEV